LPERNWTAGGPLGTARAGTELHRNCTAPRSALPAQDGEHGLRAEPEHVADGLGGEAGALGLAASVAGLALYTALFASGYWIACSLMSRAC
jgi:hypothetical protein